MRCSGRGALTSSSRISSGYGQDGPYRDRPAFGVIGEAIGGLRYLTNHPPGVTDLPPVRVGVSIGDSVAGLYAAFGVLVSLFQRDRSSQARISVDVALTESILSLMEGMLPEYGALGTIREPVGARIPTAAPSNAYPTSDRPLDPDRRELRSAVRKARIADAAYRPTGGSRAFRRQCATRDKRGRRSMMRSRRGRLLGRAADLERLLTTAEIPVTKVFTAADVATDPQYRLSRYGPASRGPTLRLECFTPESYRTSREAPGVDLDGRARRSASNTHRRRCCATWRSYRQARIAELREEKRPYDLVPACGRELVEIVEVGPRDGFQMIHPWIPVRTARKLALVRGLHAAGLRRVDARLLRVASRRSTARRHS